ncbi:MAG TPA: tetratricopeptide repeat protein [Gemmatimonadaceae bacterium]|nr:tetratricopeptide repeat protein [Gemmatimonadaceae bacterium]
MSHIKSLAHYALAYTCICGVGAASAARLTAQNPEGRETAGSLWVAATRAAAAGDHEEERHLMARASELAPQHPAPLLGLARADALTGHTDEALQILGRLADIGFSRFDPADSAFHLLSHDRRYAPVVARLAENRLPIISSDTAFVVPGANRIPENIAYDPRDSIFYIGSLAQHTVTRIGPGGDTSRIAGAEDGLLRVVGMKVDTLRNRLWVATWGVARETAQVSVGREYMARLFAFDLTSGRKLLMLTPRDTLHDHSFNDLVVAPTGDVYITDTDEGSIWRVRVGTDTLERFSTPDPAHFTAANGIALDDRGQCLYVAFTEGIARIDVHSGRARLLAVPSDVTTASVDGLYWYRGDLIGVQMARSVERVVRFTLDHTGSRVLGARVLERSHPAFRFPTTGVIVRDSLYYIANPGWDRLGDDGEIQPADTPSPTIILRLPLR